MKKGILLALVALLSLVACSGEGTVDAPIADDEVVAELVDDEATARGIWPETPLDESARRAEETMRARQELWENRPDFRNFPENFNFDYYGWWLERFSSDIVLGQITSEASAKTEAEAVWSEIWSRNIMNSRDFMVRYDSENDIWFIQGTLPPSTLGMVPSILIRGIDGQVLAVWSD
ncbi:MAG: YbbC/YhhH family protein [Oscillospiraceae bacterium]|nr:YbbC/YhhH family protein [Oscillospiraceae bacterium]